MHRIRSDQLYHHYMGDPLEVLMLYPDGTGAVTTVGSDLAAGERPQLFVPGDTSHTSRLGPTTPFWPALSGQGWSPPTWSTGTSRRWSSPTPIWLSTSALSRAEHDDPTWHVREVVRCRRGTMLLLSALSSPGFSAPCCRTRGATLDRASRWLPGGTRLRRSSPISASTSGLRSPPGQPSRSISHHEAAETFRDPRR